MLEIYGYRYYAGDYCVVIYINSSIGYLSISTKFPRVNKYITISSIISLTIINDVSLIDKDFYGRGSFDRINIRDVQKFIHKLLMNLNEEEIILGGNLQILYDYRKNEHK